MSRVTEFFQGEISGPGRLALALVALALVPAIFLPVWEITLEAPQYPQGLTMQIYAHELKGDISEINILNHYIGMHEIRGDEFREFIFIPFFILRFAGFAMVVYLAGIQGISRDYYDYAVLEGAGPWRRLRHITWPLLWPQTFALDTIVDEEDRQVEDVVQNLDEQEAIADGPAILGYLDEAFHYFGHHTFDFRTAFPPLAGWDLDEYLESVSHGVSDDHHAPRRERLDGCSRGPDGRRVRASRAPAGSC